MQTLFQDVRYALRQLGKAPAFAVTAILTLALGIGANTAVFSLLDQALLRSLPVHDPQKLVVLEGTGKAWEGHSSNHGGDPEAYFSYPMYKDLRDHNQSEIHAFEGLIATAPADIGFARNGSSQNARAEMVSGNYFTVLGIEPALGRLFTQSEDAQKDANPVAVLSFDFWKDHLGADPSIVGESVSINGRQFQVIGVSAPRFRSAVWGETPGVFVPMSMLGAILPGKDAILTDHTDKWLNIVGRIQANESRSQVEVAMAPLWHALRAEELKALGTKSKRFTDGFLTNSRLRLVPGARGFSYDRADYQNPLLAVMGMAALVLFIAGVNVASLLLVRSAARVREFALRFALGAQAGRIVRQLLLEGLLIGVAGGAAGLALATLAVRVLVHRLIGDESYGAFTSSVDARMLLFNFTVAIAVSIFFSLAPALQLRRPNLASTLGQRAGTSVGGALSLRRVVVCVQIGLSVVLLVSAGLFVRTMQKLRAVNVGYETAHLVSFGINPKLAGYAPAAIPALNQRVLDRLTTLPGVQAVAATNDVELAGHGQGGNVTVTGFTAPAETDYDIEEPFVNAAYFSALRVPLLAGRTFTEDDAAGHPMVAVVNETFAKHFCTVPSSCVGRLVGNGGGDNVKPNIEIVGIVRDTKHEGIRDDIDPTMFRPLRQNADPAILFFYLRTYGDPNEALATIRRTMQQLDSKLALTSLRTMDQQIEDDLSNDRLVLLLAVSFGVLAALLAGVGIYGVLAYSTAQRTREIGIRIALGSSRLGVTRIILGDLLMLAGIGIAVALPAAYGLSHLLQSQLFGVSPADPVALITAILLIALVALVAALIPAQRAASIDPIKALRNE